MPVVFIRSHDLSLCVALGKTVFASFLRIMRAHRSRRPLSGAAVFGSYTVDVWSGGLIFVLFTEIFKSKINILNTIHGDAGDHAPRQLRW